MSHRGLRGNRMCPSPAVPCSFPVPPSPGRTCPTISSPASLPVVCTTSGTDVSYILLPGAVSTGTLAVPWCCWDTGILCLCYTVALGHRSLRVLSPAIATPGVCNRAFSFVPKYECSGIPGSLLVAALGRCSMGVNTAMSSGTSSASPGSLSSPERCCTDSAQERNS